MSFSDIELAFDFVSGHGQGEVSAFVSKKTGDTFWVSDDLMDDEELPEDLYESDDYVEVPHKNELDLGQALVFRFVRDRMTNDIDQVRDIFSRRGAYGRFKALLERRNLLDSWHEFDDQQTKQALVDWCEENGIKVDTNG